MLCTGKKVFKNVKEKWSVVKVCFVAEGTFDRYLQYIDLPKKAFGLGRFSKILLKGSSV